MEKVLRAVWSFSFWSKSELSQIETLFSMALQTTGSILGGVWSPQGMGVGVGGCQWSMEELMGKRIWTFAKSDCDPTNRALVFTGTTFGPRFKWAPALAGMQIMPFVST